MLDSDHPTNNGLTSVEPNTSTEQIEGSLNNASNLKSLIPTNVSYNKKAVIERLIALHLSHD